VKASRKLGELLVERKVLNREALEEVLVEEERSGEVLTAILLARNLVAERDLVAAVAEHAGVDFWDAQVRTVAPLVLGMLPFNVATRLGAVVVEARGDHLGVAMLDPASEAAIDEIAATTGWSITPLLIGRQDFRRVVGEVYGERVQLAGDEETADEVETKLHINALLEEMVAMGASDLHLTSGLPPSVRVDGAISPMAGREALNGSDLRELIYEILSQHQRERFEADLELDTSHSVPNVGRFRLNVFSQRDCVGAVLRAIPFKIVPLEQLGMPPTVSQFAELARGLVLVTGPTGSGKSTTLASLIDSINSTRPCHIITVEDPIEFLHRHKRAVVNQREVGEDTRSFGEALKRALRQDPDVILVGELRDLETISTALTAAETGHLVFATLHTQDAPQSVDRIIDVFPAHQQQQIRIQLAASLQGIITQQLLPRARTRGRAVACEVLVATPAVRNLIREAKGHQIYSTMQAGAKFGMQTMDHSLGELVRQGTITLEVALDHCHSPSDLRRLAGVAA
jgi:twitching motility protein PilT